MHDKFLNTTLFLISVDSAQEVILRTLAGNINEEERLNFRNAISTAYDCLEPPIDDKSEYTIKHGRDGTFNMSIREIAEFVSNFSCADVEIKHVDVSSAIKAYRELSL